MSIDSAFYAFCAADADNRVSKNGKPWTRLRVGVGKDDAVQWVQVAVFGKAAEKAAENRPDQKQKERDFGSAPAVAGDAPFDDEITFAPEWRG